MRTNTFRLVVTIIPLALLAAYGAAQQTTPASEHAGHAGHGSEPKAAGDSTPGTPAAVLRPDALDAPAPTSVDDAARAAAMAEQMAGAHHHMSHAPYSHVDAGRVPATSPVQRDSSAPPPASPHHEHGKAPSPRATPKPREHQH